MLRVLRVAQRRCLARYSSTAILDFLQHNTLSYTTIPELEPLLSQLSITDQTALVQQYPNLINVQFQTLLKQGTYHDNFQFILAHHAQLYPELIQVYIYNLLASNYVMPAVALLHKLSDSSTFQLANEIWSILVSKVCENHSHFGAIFIYHNLINNYKYYTDEPSTYVRENNLVPFLVNVETIEQLAMIFTNYKDAARVEGMFDYFTRFYSYAYNKKVYKSLLILLVESYSEINMSAAFTHFNQLMSAHDEKSSKRFTGKEASTKATAIQRRVVDNAKVRLDNVMYNKNVYTTLTDADKTDDSLKKPLDIHQELVAKLNGVGLYNPIIQRNVYSRDYPKKKPIAILSGTISLLDLPKFHHMIHTHVEQILSSGEATHKLVNICLNNHVNITMFVMASLCDLNKLDLILELVPQLHAQIKRHDTQKPIINNETFLYILTKYPQHTLRSLEELYKWHVEINKIPTVTFLHQFITKLLSIPTISKYDIEQYIKAFLKLQPHLQLDPVSFANYTTIKGLEPYNKFISCK
ncbi:uncharacterized protein SPAPADRAFT_63551 [Spathaspora passalidarum NRRL Y-27907]|uniref:ATPase expression protein 1 n=1 Tax=Spathaspora passalidarum (strain NRRL Y-27907 / 11-Y1) TaxID=619300 RepID=G3AVH6_SPAPN|nr:uncharacterized protein SPAPADRAFT_63551 [Spathaspora passalidarum NRRL Y-27907]EGW29925.1 hypothetical protein SPAPADRAFT_63551 [Spathaspora passalidarum NRRL Y-27907]